MEHDEVIQDINLKLQNLENRVEIFNIFSHFISVVNKFIYRQWGSLVLQLLW